MRELKTFRQNYPQYDSIDDGVIVQKLADKYPEAYGDLPVKYQASQVGEIKQAPSFIDPLVAQWKRKSSLVAQGLVGDVPFVRTQLPEETRKVEPVNKREETLRDAVDMAKSFALWETVAGKIPHGSSFLTRRVRDLFAGGAVGGLTADSEDPKKILTNAALTGGAASVLGGATEGIGAGFDKINKIVSGRKGKLVDSITEELRRLYVNTKEVAPNMAQTKAAGNVLNKINEHGGLDKVSFKMLDDTYKVLKRANAKAPIIPKQNVPKTLNEPKSVQALQKYKPVLESGKTPFEMSGTVKKTTPETLLSKIRKEGGIDPESLKSLGYNIKDDIGGFGLTSVMKKGGVKLDSWAEEAVNSGIIQKQEGETASEAVMRTLQQKPSALPTAEHELESGYNDYLETQSPMEESETDFNYGANVSFADMGKPQPTSKSVDPIETEAKKYKSADEFVASQIDDKDMLYHGSSEGFFSGEFDKSGVDNVAVWTTNDPRVAQNYIPDTGIESSYSFNNVIKMEDSVNPNSYSDKIFDLFGGKDSIFEDVKYRNGNEMYPESWYLKKEITHNDVKRKLESLGYKDKSGWLKISDSKIVPIDYKQKSDLFIFKGKKKLKLKDLRIGDTATGADGTMDYNRFNDIEKAKEEGYDGVIINDYAQSKSMGNLGHISYGIFPEGVKKLTKEKITAENFDEWDSGEKTTKEYKNFIGEKTKQLTEIWNKANKPTLKASSGYASSPKPDTATEWNVFTEADKEATLPNLSKIKGVELPELVKLATELSGISPSLKKFPSARGMFYPDSGRIKLNPKIFKEPNEAAAVLAHEIGHLADWLPDFNMKRGNEIGRTVSMVTRFMKSTFDPLKGEAASGKQLAQIRKSALKEFVSRNNIKASYIKDDPELKKAWGLFLKNYKKGFLEGAGFIVNDTLRSELKALTQQWKPFNEAEAPPSYLGYRYSASELYADFVSVLLNAPKIAQEVAPTTYKTFFDFLDRKPAVRQAYMKLQSFLSGDQAQIFNMRQKDIYQMFDNAETEVRAIKERGILAKKSVLDHLKQMFIDKDHFVLKGRKQVAKKKSINPEDDPKYWLDENNYIGSVVKGHVSDLQPTFEKMMKQGLDNEVGMMLFLERVASGDRTEIANPLGHTPKTAKDFIEEFKKRDPEKYAKAEGIVTEVREWFSGINKLMAEDILTESQKEMVFSNDKYAPYRVTKHLKDYMSAGIAPQSGTLSEIGNPFNAMVLKGISMVRAAERNAVKKNVGNFIASNPDVYGKVEKAKITSYPGVFRVAPHKDANMKPVVWRDKGKWDGIYVDKSVANSFENDTTGVLAVTGDVINKVLMNNLFRNLYITFNPGFQVMNIQRDFIRFWKNAPNMTFIKVLKAYKRAFPHAVNRVRGTYDSLINEMEKEKAIGITYNDFLQGESTEDKEITSIMRQWGLEPTPVKKLNYVFTPFATVMEAIKQVGDVVETIPKVAGYMELKDLPQKQRTYYVRNFVGTPNYKRSGSLKPLYNNVMMFSNIIKEAYRGMYEIGFEDAKTSSRSQSRMAWAWKTAKFNIMPKILMALAAGGLFGPAIKEMYAKMNEYDKTSYGTIPLFVLDSGKVVYARMIQDEEGRFFSAILWKLMNSKNSGIMNALTDILSFTGEQVPFAGGLSPSLQIGNVWKEYLTGKNPRDNYRGRDILTDQEFEAGGFHAIVPLLKWTANQSGLVKLSIHDAVRNQSIFEKVITMTPVLNRIIRVSDWGIAETLYNELGEAKKEKARRDIPRKAIERKAIKGEITTKEALSEIEPEKRLYSKKSILSQKQALTDPIAKVLRSATINEQKTRVLDKAVKEGYIKDVNKYTKQLVNSKVISTSFRKKYINHRKKYRQ